MAFTLRATKHPSTGRKHRETRGAGARFAAAFGTDGGWVGVRHGHLAFGIEQLSDHPRRMELDLLRSVSIFRSLDDAELASVAALLTVREIPARNRILEEGTEVKALYIVCDGVDHVRRMAQKREMLLNRLGVGAFFGEINLFDPGLATASIYAMKNSRIASVDYGSFRAFMEAHPATGYKIVTAMMVETVRRLRQTSARLVNVVYWSSADATQVRMEG